MRDRQIVAMGALLGAAVGIAASYLLFTRDGRRLRADFEPELNGLMGEIGRVKGAYDELRRSLLSDDDTAASWPRRSA